MNRNAFVGGAIFSPRPGFAGRGAGGEGFFSRHPTAPCQSADQLSEIIVFKTGRQSASRRIVTRATGQSDSLEGFVHKSLLNSRLHTLAVSGFEHVAR